MFEQQIIDQYRLGKLSGITEAPNCFYIPLRITGTGTTKRIDGEGNTYYEERVKSQYFTPAVLKHCASLPITLGHPVDDNGELTIIKPEIFDRIKIVGQTVDAWVKGEEIWGLARIYDKSIMLEIGSGDLASTSPGVVTLEVYTTDAKSGEAPLEFNHLAIVKAGHWDQIPGSQGFENLNKEETNMSEGVMVGIQDVEADIMQTRSDEAKEEAKDEKGSEEKGEETKKEGDKEMADSKVEVVDEDVEILDAEGEDNVEVDEDEDNVEVDEDEDNVEVDEDEDNVEVDEDEDSELVDEEVIASDSEEKEDKDRNEVLDQMRTICDSAHTSLRIKMPYIKDRETCRSVINKFAIQNRAYVSSKFKNLRLDSLNNELAREVLNDIQDNVSRLSSTKQATKAKGFVPSKYGFVDPNF